MLMGRYAHSLDAKGRLIIPSRLREELGENFVIMKNLDHCLSLYPEKEWEKFTEALKGLPVISSEPARKLQRFIFANSDSCEVDKQGRALIPSVFRTYAGLEKDVILIGVQNHAEIWDAERYAAYEAAMDEEDLTAGLDGLIL